MPGLGLGHARSRARACQVGGGHVGHERAAVLPVRLARAGVQQQPPAHSALPQQRAVDDEAYMHACVLGRDRVSARAAALMATASCRPLTSSTEQTTCDS